MPIEPEHEARAAGEKVNGQASARPSRRFIAQGPITAAPSLTALLGAVVAVGVAAGFLELGVFLFQVHVLHWIWQGIFKISRHSSWMIPVAGSCVAITAMLALTIPSVMVARRNLAVKWCWEWCGAVLGTFLVLGPILAIRGLHGGAALFVAMATGYRLRRVVMRQTPRWDVMAKWCGAIAIVFLPAYALARWNAVLSAEGRAWALTTPAPSTPNLLWIVMDTVGAEHLSLYGYERKTTPALEVWAGRGITFEGARSAASWTMPSHLTMLTGLWPYQHGGRVDRPYTGPSPTVAEYLADRGYATAGFAANAFMCNACYGVGRGFDRYVDHPCNQDVGFLTMIRNSPIGVHALRGLRKLGVPVKARFDLEKALTAPEITKLGRDWLDRARTRNAVDARPTFLFLNFMDAHSPYTPPPGKPRQFWTGRDLTEKETEPQAGWYVLRLRDKASPEERPQRQVELDAVTQRMCAVYDDCIAGLDAELGRFLNNLRDSGQLDNTWVVITADHGELFGEHGQFGHASSLYDGLTHVPLVLIPPAGAKDAPRGRRVPAPVSLRDLPATVAELLAPGAKSPFLGRSLTRFWMGSPNEPVAPDPILAQEEEQRLEGPEVEASKVKTMDALYDEGHVLIVGKNQPDELYDLAADPKQLNNLAADPSKRELIERLRKTMNTVRSE